MSSAYQQLAGIFSRRHHLSHLSAIAGWDQATMMPPKGNEARAAAQAELGVLLHEMMTAAGLRPLLDAAEQEHLSDWERANLLEMRREWAMANTLPSSLVSAKALASARCEHAWRRQRADNDWAGFLENFCEVVRLAREEGRLLGASNGLSPYDAQMDKYEPGMTSERVETIFNAVKTWLPSLIGRIRDQQASETVLQPQGPFPVEKQKALGLAVMQRLGFDFEAGRLDVSLHPFCGGVPEDVRITTRYRDDDFVQSLMGIVHETGHACYEQHLPRAWLSQPVGRARSMGIHESQSLSFEMQLGRSRPFLQWITPLIQQQFGTGDAWSADNLALLYTRVKPGRIRVDADELCYPAHVMLRFEIERALINAEIEPEDVPALWDEKMQSYLGIDTRGDYRNGCLQDIHWTDSFGYFPSYTLGAMCAAQYFARLRQEVPDLDRQIAAGELTAVFDWLNTHIWRQGCRYPTDELLQLATGETLNPAHYRRHLETRYLA